MNEREAIKIIEKDRYTKCDTLHALPENARKNAVELNDMIEAEAMAIIAMGKQDAKKPIEHVQKIGFPHYECPSCGEIDVYEQNYCDNCGQKLDWNEEE